VRAGAFNLTSGELASIVYLRQQTMEVILPMTKTKVKPADYLFWAVKQPVENTLSKLLLIILADRADKHGKSWASKTTLARDCGCTSRAINDAQNRLKEAGLIDWEARTEKGVKTSNKYTVILAESDRNLLPIDRNLLPIDREASSYGVGKLVPIKHPSLNTQLNTQVTPIVPFDEFYCAYPKKVGRSSAKKAWDKLNPQPALINRIMKDIVDRVELGAWDTGKDKQYIPGPAPYLNQQRWEDEIIPRPEFKKPNPINFDEVEDLTENI